MINSVSRVHFAVVQNLREGEKEEKTLDVGQQAIKNTSHETSTKKSLCDRFFEVLKRIKSSFQAIFYRHFPCFRPSIADGNEALPKTSVSNDTTGVEVKKQAEFPSTVEAKIELTEPKRAIDTCYKVFNVDDLPEYMNAFYALAETQQKERESLDLNQMNQWYEALKNKIILVPPEHINIKSSIGDNERGTRNLNGLLFNAIRYISNSDRRLEIVQLLLDKGADPTLMSVRNKSLNTIEFAARKNHQPLIDLIREHTTQIIRNDEDERNIKKRAEGHRHKDAALIEGVSFAAYLQAFEILYNENQPFSELDLRENIEPLKQLILKIRSSQINELQVIETDERNIVVIYDLLHMAIAHITDNDKCMEIVQLLLNQGANPSYASCSKTYVSILDIARETNDQRLIDLIESKFQKIA